MSADGQDRTIELRGGESVVEMILVLRRKNEILWKSSPFQMRDGKPVSFMAEPFFKRYSLKGEDSFRQALKHCDEIVLQARVRHIVRQGE